MLYRFADDQSLATWEASPQRQWWLGAAQGLVGESQVERRTGIEGWFDPPVTHDVQDLRPAAPAPPRWKQACVIFLVFFPLSLLRELAQRPLPRRRLAARAGADRRARDDPGDDLPGAAVDHPPDGVVAAGPARTVAAATLELGAWPT